MAEMYLEYSPRWDAHRNHPKDFGTLPPVVDHRKNQTPVRHQKDRGTCVCFAALAGMEAVIKVQEGREVDLSEQYANWVLTSGEGKNQCDDGLRTTLAARYLSQRGVCEEVDLSYEDRNTVFAHRVTGPPPDVQHRAKFGIKEFAIIEGLGPFGRSLGNTDYLESILHNGYDIVFGMHLAWGKPDENFVYDIMLDEFGRPIPSRGGHAMLAVGYDRTGPKPFFIMKNSWGEAEGKDGYFFLSYDYVRRYAKNGFIIKSVNTNMPTARQINYGCAR